jgi:MoxR-like ATPase
MFVTRARYEALRARYVEVLDERDAARRSAKESGDSVIQLAASTARAGQEAERGRAVARSLRSASRLGRALRACARYRAESAALRQQVAAVLAAYDHAVGLDSPALDMGVHWQQRRSDRPVPKAVDPS